MMPKTKAQKGEVLDALTSTFTNMKSAVFTSFRGLNITDEHEFRKQARKMGASYVVAKKSLMKLALHKAGLSQVDPTQFKAETGVLVSATDEVAPAKLVATFGKDKSLKILGGILEGVFIDASRVKSLSLIPGKQELLAMMVGSIQAPVSGFVRVLAGNLRGLVQVLSQIQKQKQS